jgi:hypothetical protein
MHSVPGTCCCLSALKFVAQDHDVRSRPLGGANLLHDMQIRDAKTILARSMGHSVILCPESKKMGEIQPAPNRDDSNQLTLLECSLTGMLMRGVTLGSLDGCPQVQKTLDRAREKQGQMLAPPVPAPTAANTAAPMRPGPPPVTPQRPAYNPVSPRCYPCWLTTVQCPTQAAIQQGWPDHESMARELLLFWGLLVPKKIPPNGRGQLELCTPRTLPIAGDHLLSAPSGLASSSLL